MFDIRGVKVVYTSQYDRQKTDQWTAGPFLTLQQMKDAGIKYTWHNFVFSASVSTGDTWTDMGSRRMSSLSDYDDITNADLGLAEDHFSQPDVSSVGRLSTPLRCDCLKVL